MAFWEEGVIGAAAKEDIPPNKAYVFVPYSICINIAKAKSSEIRQVLQKKFFTQHSRANDHILWVFVMFEKLKGPHSLWHHYFSTITGFNNLIDWTESDLSELQDDLIVHDNTKWKQRIARIWLSVKKIIGAYPEYFPPDQDLENIFLWAWRVCCTRGYAWDGGMLIPMADNMNHGEVYTSYESEERIVLLELARDVSSEVDYSDFLNIHKQVNFQVDPRHNTNRLEKYVLEKNDLPGLESIGELEKVLEEYRSSSSEDDERNIAECTSDEESAFDQLDLLEEIVPEPDKFFMMSSGVRTSFRKGDQVLNAYGRLNNRNLLLDYGFAIEDNRYDTVYFLMWTLDSGREGLVAFEDIQEKSPLYAEGTELYGLKLKRLNLDVFVYFREIMGMSVKQVPSDLDKELEVIDKFFDVLCGLKSGFKTELEFDLELLQRNPPFKLKSALYYRINQKKIVNHQVKMLETLRSEIEKIKTGAKLQTYLKDLTLEQIKAIYPLRVYLRSLEIYLKDLNTE